MTDLDDALGAIATTALVTTLVSHKGTQLVIENIGRSFSDLLSGLLSDGDQEPVELMSRVRLRDVREAPLFTLDGYQSRWVAARPEQPAPPAETPTPQIHSGQLRLRLSDRDGWAIERERWGDELAELVSQLPATWSPPKVPASEL